MDLIIVHGPPASGKLTIGKGLEKNGCKLMHNHALIDLLTPVLERSKDFWKLGWKIRHMIIAEAIEQDVDCIVMTLACKGHDLEKKKP